MGHFIYKTSIENLCLRLQMDISALNITKEYASAYTTHFLQTILAEAG